MLYSVDFYEKIDLYLGILFGSGYRVCFGENADNIVVLLCRGIKTVRAEISKMPRNIGEVIKVMVKVKERTYRTLDESEKEGGFKNQLQQLMFNSDFGEFHIMQELSVNLYR